jgi:hypothetical protein
MTAGMITTRAVIALGLAGLAACSSPGLGEVDVDASDSPPPPDAPVSLDARGTHDAAPAGADAAPVAPTAYRLDAVTLQDPHVFLDLLGACVDVTDQVNTAISDKLTKDADHDGNLDYSLVLLFAPLDQTPGDMPTGTFVTASCTAPAAGTTCNGAGASRASATVTNLGSGTCLAPAAGTTTHSYTPPVNAPAAPCFSSASTSYSFTAGGANITLEDAELAAAYGGNPATSLTHGLMRGFLRQADADLIMVDLSAIGDGLVPLGQLFAGGLGSCVGDHSDRDTGPNGEPGWYLYFNFTAVKVAYTE